MILLNTPHNPVGKVFTREELEKIAALAEEFNLIVVSDEVVRPGAVADRPTSHMLIRFCSSTTPWSSKGATTSVSPRFPACGTAP